MTRTVQSRTRRAPSTSTTHLHAAGVDTHHPLRVIVCTVAVHTPTYKRGTRGYVIGLRDVEHGEGQVRIWVKCRQTRVWETQWFPVWELSRFAIRVIRPRDEHYRFRRLHAFYGASSTEDVNVLVNTLWADWYWRRDNRYRYLHGMETVDGMTYTPGWIDAFAHSWAFLLVTECARKDCVCEGKPSRRERP